MVWIAIYLHDTFEPAISSCIAAYVCSNINGYMGAIHGITYCTVKWNTAIGRHLSRSEYDVFDSVSLLHSYMRRRSITYYPPKLYKQYREFRNSSLWRKYKEVGSAVSELDVFETYEKMDVDEEDIPDPLFPFLYGYKIVKFYSIDRLCHTYLTPRLYKIYITKHDVRLIECYACRIKRTPQRDCNIDLSLLSRFPIRYVKCMVKCFMSDIEVCEFANQKSEQNYMLSMLTYKICAAYASELYARELSEM